MSARAQWAQALGAAAPQPARKRVRNSTAMRAIAKAHAPAITTRQRHGRYLKDIEALQAHDAAIPEVQVYPVEAVPKPRMSQRDKWEERPQVVRYRAYCDELRLRGARLPFAYEVQFVLPMPAGWPADLRALMDGKPHLLRPDTSNLCKSIEDALVPKDEVIHHISASKRWGTAPSITIKKLP